ncbi:MAG: PilZ domain-containing protein [Succinivibrionaceae bacterium]
MIEKRHFHRINYEIPGTFTVNNICHEVKIKNLSLQGMLIELININEISLVIGMEGVLCVHLSEDISPFVNVSIVRIENHFLGLKICNVDLEALTYIRTICVLNAENQNVNYQELEHLIK